MGDIYEIHGTFASSTRRSCNIRGGYIKSNLLVTILYLVLCIHKIVANSDRIHNVTSAISTPFSPASLANFTASRTYSSKLTSPSSSQTYPNSKSPRSYENFLVASSTSRELNKTLSQPEVSSSESDGSTKNKTLREVKLRNHNNRHDKNRVQNNRKKKTKRKMTRLRSGVEHETQVSLRKHRDQHQNDSAGISDYLLDTPFLSRTPKISINPVNNVNNNERGRNNETYANLNAIHKNIINMQYPSDSYINKSVEEKIRTKKGHLLIREDEGYVIYKNYHGLVPCPPGYPYSPIRQKYYGKFICRSYDHILL